ncbi:hypothetical protein [Sediminimonas qiaohouensis]|uniref:hypothetical protein n=1 Tax=Sediminimonas qiaohouensis TaxID=552061 RepID=UPI00042674A4|nr:hypothetical protein [Sediminimonas qiaohouensis]
MEISDRPVVPLPRRRVAAFVALFVLLYAGAAGIAEVTIGRSGQETAFQKLLAMRGTQVDWLVLGASHALPLAFGEIPKRLEADTGQSMAVLAEVGAGPLYNGFVFRQAKRDIAPRHLLYVVDSFAFTSPRWNEERITDRKLLRKTPLRPSTAAIMADLTIRRGIKPAALADYLTAFSKLNPPDRFPQEGWRGAEDFDNQVRLSRHAVQSRIDYLYPDQAQTDVRNAYFDVLFSVFDAARASGMQVVVVKLPLPEPFREALPNEADFDAALRARLRSHDIPFHDLSTALPDLKYFFDTDHLNRAGIDALYAQYLRDLMTSAGSP